VGLVRKPCIEKGEAALVQIICALACDINALARPSEAPTRPLVKPWFIVKVEMLRDHIHILFREVAYQNHKTRSARRVA